MGIGSALKRLANTAERIAHTEVRGTDKIKGAVRRSKAAIERERIKRKATKAAKDEQKYQDFIRDYERKKIERDIERTKDEIEEIKAERRKLERRSSFSMFGGPGRHPSLGRKKQGSDPLKFLVGDDDDSNYGRKNSGRSRGSSITKRTASGYSFHNILNTGKPDRPKGGGRKKSRSMFDMNLDV